VHVWRHRSSSKKVLALYWQQGMRDARKDSTMEQILQQTVEGTIQSRCPLDAQVTRIIEELRQLVMLEDWEAIKNVLRVLDAHGRARTLRAQGQPARAHLWLVGLGYKQNERRRRKQVLAAKCA
jgi:hypothetical protein